MRWVTQTLLSHFRTHCGPTGPAVCPPLLQCLALTSSIPATCSEMPLMLPIHRTTPNSGGSLTSTMEPTSSSLSCTPASSFSSGALHSSGDLSGDGGSTASAGGGCCRWSLRDGDVGLRGLGGGRGGRGGRGLWAGLGGGSGGVWRACLEGGIRAILGAEVSGDVGLGLVAGGGRGFRMDLGYW